VQNNKWYIYNRTNSYRIEGFDTPKFTRESTTPWFKAIARAFRWRDMLESGEYATIREIAAAEKINETYVDRVLRLTLLAPDLIEAILDGRQPADLQLEELLRPFPVECGSKRR
jgi:hypothetical protein